MKVDGNDISMTRGDSGGIYVRCYDSSNAMVPLVEGDTIYFTVKESAAREDKLIQKVVTEFSEGIAYIPIFPEDTKPLRFKRPYIYDVQLTRAGGSVHTIVRPAKFTVLEEVTYE